MNELEIVGTFESRPGNPAVTVDSRKLVSMQPIDNPQYRVVELLPDGSKKPFPNEKWASAVGPDGVGMQAVIGIRADTNGIVWMLDMGGDEHAPKLVGWDTKRDSLSRVIVFPASASRENSFHQDLAVDTERNMAYVADMTLGGVTGESLPAIVVIDLDTRLVRRVLEGNEHFAPGREKVVIDGNTFATKSENGEIVPIYFGLNPITIDPNNEWVYFGSINGKGLFRIPASALADPRLADAKRAALIEPYGEKRSSDGISIDDKGNVYVSDVENHAIGVANPGGYQTLVRDEKLLKWPDGFAFGPDGWLYVTANQLNLHPNLNGGTDGGEPPFYLLRVKPLAAGSVGR
jgi:sugar lactone lactonase YvrE